MTFYPDATAASPREAAYRDTMGRLGHENARLRAALEDIRDGLAPYRERLSSQQAKNAYDIAAQALAGEPQASAFDERQKP